MRHLLIALIIAMLLTSCGTISNRYRPELLADDSPREGNGIVVLSAGAKHRCVTLATFLKVLAVEQPYHAREYALLSVDAYAVKSDFQGYHGSLHALELPAGRYYVAPWLAHPAFDPLRIPKFEFSVSSGETTYLGEYFLEEPCASTTLGYFRDQSLRDLEILKARKPRLDVSEVRLQVPSSVSFAVDEQQ